MKKVLLSALLLFAVGFVRAATVGDTFVVYDYFHEYTTGGIGQYDGHEYAYDFQSVSITAPDGTTTYYGGAGGSLGIEGYLANTITLDQPGTWHVNHYSEHDEVLRHDSNWWEETLEVYPL